jgi:hypothetical protein
MPHGVDIEDGTMEVVALWEAATPAELHRVLVLYPPIRRTSDAHEPFALLEKHNEIEPAASVTTAMLLLTDLRWRGGVGDLARRIEASAILESDVLGLLAQAFLAADDAVYWAVPDDWFSEGITIDLDDPGSSADADDTADDPGSSADADDTADDPGSSADADDTADDPGSSADADDTADEPRAVARRVVVPPLRRWASEWMTRHDPSAWSSLLARARELDSRSGAAIVVGVLDAIECLDPRVQQFVISRAIRWPHQSVRRPGLALIADRDGPEAAYALGKDDRDARIRAWAESLVRPGTGQPADGGPRVRRATEAADSAEPPKLF